MGSDWRRRFRFVIPVRHPDHWSNPKVLAPLGDALSFLSEDDYVFEFEKAANPVPLGNYLELSEESGAFKADEVVPFSGGLDSLSGAIEELSADARNVALVSHRSSPKIFGYQKQLIAELKCQFPKRLMHFPVLLTRQEPLRVQEHTQRSRSFLYAALACVVARLFGKTRLRFFENGVVSINLPISEQVVGARATRTTHPVVLERFRQFFSGGRRADRNRESIHLENQGGRYPIDCRSPLRSSHQAHCELHAQLRHHEAEHPLRLLFPVSRQAFRSPCRRRGGI